MDRNGRTFVGKGFPAAYAAGIGSCAIASVLTVAYVGGGFAQEGNPVMVALIDEIGMHSAAVARIAVVAVMFWGYYAAASVAGVPALGRWFAWIGAAIHAADALGNLAAAAMIGLAPVGALQAPTAVAILAVTGAAVVTRPPPIRDGGTDGTGPAGAPN